MGCFTFSNDGCCFAESVCVIHHLFTGDVPEILLIDADSLNLVAATSNQNQVVIGLRVVVTFRKGDNATKNSLAHGGS